ncbi:MAG: hypothetical protein U9O64_02675 [Campylobacterota bacterium]|nr:hypothetical protein [Campylobacterota bacterium]
MAVAEDIGCNNTQCVKAPKCERTAMYENGTASAVKRFGGNENVGCGKFIPKKQQ